MKHFSFAYPFPDGADLTDLLYINRSSAVRPTLQTLAPSRPTHPSPKTHWTSSVSLAFHFFIYNVVLLSPVFGVLLYVRNNIVFAFLIMSMSVPDVSPSLSALVWFDLCSETFEFLKEIVDGFRVRNNCLSRRSCDKRT